MDTNHRGGDRLAAPPLPLATATGSAPSGALLTTPAATLPAAEARTPFELAGLGAGSVLFVAAAVVTAIAAMVLVVMSLLD